MKKSFLFNSLTISTMTMLSRIFGLVRDIIIANLFGAGGVLDAFIVAFKIPNFFRRLFAEGAFSQTIMPILAEAKQQNKEQEVINHISARLLIILLIITTIGVVLAPVFIFIFAWGFYFNDLDKFYLASNMLQITFPYLLLISLTAFFGSILNTHSKFAIPAFTPVLLNVAIIVCAIFLAPQLDKPIIALAWGVLLGGVLQLLLQIPFLLKINRFPRPTNKPHQVFKTLKNRMLPALFGVSIAQINLLIDTMIATTLVAGSVSWLYYANRLMELPLALIGVALSIVGIAKLSNLFAKNDEKGFNKSLDYSLRLGVIFGFPATIALIFLAKPLIITLFQYDAFSIIDAVNSANVLMAYGVGLIFFVLIKIMVSAFLARGDTTTPVKSGVVAMLSNIILNIILAHYYSFIGLAIATSIAAIINFLILLFYLHFYKIWQISLDFFKMLIKVITASLFMLLFIVYWSNDYTNLTLWQRTYNLGFQVIVGAIIYFSCLYLLKTIKVKY